MPPVLRRSIFFLFIVGCAISLAAEGRLAPWLVVDGAVSAAFMPAVQLSALVLIWRLRIGGARLREADVLRYLDGNRSWLWWWCAAGFLFAFVPPRSIGPWFVVLFVSLLLPIVSGVICDTRWLRADCGRTRSQAATDVVLLRLIGWGAGVIWFFGIAIWYGELPKVWTP